MIIKIFAFAQIILLIFLAFFLYKQKKKAEAQYEEECGEPFSCTFKEFIDAMRYNLFNKLPKE